jgi:hypothetical protein
MSTCAKQDGARKLCKCLVVEFSVRFVLSRRMVAAPEGPATTRRVYATIGFKMASAPSPTVDATALLRTATRSSAREAALQEPALPPYRKSPVAEALTYRNSLVSCLK